MVRQMEIMTRDSGTLMLGPSLRSYLGDDLKTLHIPGSEYFCEIGDFGPVLIQYSRIST